MHLGYHELRNLLSKFKEEREKRKAAGISAAPPTAPGGPAVPPSRSNGGDRGDYRSSRDEYRDRDRDRGYERHPSRYE